MTQVWTQADSEQLRVKAQQLPVLREAAGFDMMFYRTQVRDQGGWSVADSPRHQPAVLLRKF